MRYLIVCKNYFVGDILFASSLAERLKLDNPTCEVYFNVPLAQPLDLLNNNPYIDGVQLSNDISQIDRQSADKVIVLPGIDQNYPATSQLQWYCGVTKPRTEFDVYTIPHYDELAKEEIDKLRKEQGKGKTRTVIAWQRNWEYKAYQCTPETVANGIGAPHRNIDEVIEFLSRKYVMIPVGFDRHVDSKASVAQNSALYNLTASIIKRAHWFIGSEGGLSNLAAAVHTRSIITTDFIMQNYGPNGRVRQISKPMMGPAVYYPDFGHSHLSPYITDYALPFKIDAIIENNKPEVFHF